MAKQRKQNQRTITRQANKATRDEKLFAMYNRLCAEKDAVTGRPKHRHENIICRLAMAFYLSERTVSDIIYAK
jgi:response regulator RpfG family c-di-GMP phosphodiesterase